MPQGLLCPRTLMFEERPAAYEGGADAEAEMFPCCGLPFLFSYVHCADVYSTRWVFFTLTDFPQTPSWPAPSVQGEGTLFWRLDYCALRFLMGAPQPPGYILPQHGGGQGYACVNTVRVRERPPTSGEFLPISDLPEQVCEASSASVTLNICPSHVSLLFGPGWRPVWSSINDR
jgi:hypothetical protein